jgi:4-amino-4-deoxy-L-arabinose transferase-like glycosyltransferase
MMCMRLNASDRSRPAVRRHSWWVAGLTLVLLVAGDWHQAMIGFDSRFVVFAQEMLRHGPGFFPTTYGAPYPDYSAASTWLVYALSLPFGQVNRFTAWLPSALAAACTALLIYRLLAGYCQRWALLAVAWMLLSVTFISEARAVSLDLMLAAIALAVFYLAYAADHFAAPRRTLALVALLVLGFAVRGPIGLVITTGMLCSYYLLSGQYRRLFGFGFMALALLLGCIGLLLWLADISGGPSFVSEVVRMQVIGRLDGSEGASSASYYFISAWGNYALAYPFAVAVLAVAAWQWRQPRGAALRLLGWCAAAGLLVMLGLSIPQAKKARYLLPMLPMAAIVAAYPFAVLPGPDALNGRGWAILRGIAQLVWLVLPGVLIAGLLLGRQRLPEAFVPLGVVLSLLGLLQVLAAAALMSRPGLRAIGLAGGAVAAVWASYILVVEPVQRRLYDTRSLTQAVLQRLDAQPAALVLYGMGKDAKAIKFMVNANRDLKPLFADSPEQLQRLPTPAWLMLGARDYGALQSHWARPPAAVLSGRFDNEDYLLVWLEEAL